MPAIDDPIGVQLEAAKENAEFDIEQALARATVASVLSLLPGIGSAIQSLLDGKAQRTVEQRWLQLFVDLRERVEDIRDTIPDENYYSSEEFQTLLALAYEQLFVTHDRKKLKMLAAALANSGQTIFAEDDKEILVRILRDLAPSDINLLSKFQLKEPAWLPPDAIYRYKHTPKFTNPDPAFLSGISRLVAAGLVIENFEIEPPPQSSTGSKKMDAQIQLEHALKVKAPKRTFQISALGLRFVAFVESSEKAQECVTDT